MPGVAQEPIRDRLDWVNERFSIAIENFGNETELGLTLLQSRRMLREQVWPLCETSFHHKRLLIFLINALDRVRPKSITKSQLNLLKKNIALLATEEVTIEELREAEDDLLTVE